MLFQCGASGFSAACCSAVSVAQSGLETLALEAGGEEDEPAVAAAEPGCAAAGKACRQIVAAIKSPAAPDRGRAGMRINAGCCRRS